jgi:AcrR family transcriptional regulator
MGIISKKKKIILAAIAEFAKDGFEKASMDAVALRAKVAKGTVFYHFKSKTELFEEIVAEGQKGLEEKISREIEGLKTNKEKIEKIIEIEVEFIKKYHDLFLVYLGDVVKKPLSLNVINSVLDNGIKMGEFRKNLDIETAAMSLFWMTAMVSLNLKNTETKEIQRMVLGGILT